MLSSANERLIKNALKDAGENMVCIRKSDLTKTATVKDIAFSCYHSGILFHWSSIYYYFKKG